MNKPNPIDHVVLGLLLVVGLPIFILFAITALPFWIVGRFASRYKLFADWL
jgi:hypothetical protein